MNGAAINRLMPWFLPVILIVVWQSLSSAGFLASRVLPSPAAVLFAGIHLTATGELPLHLFESFRRALAGLLIGGSIGLLLGLLNGLSAPANRLLDSSVQMVRNIPHLAMIPLVILWFGIGEEAKLFLIAVGVFFPLYINTVHGIRSINPRLIEMARSYRLGRLGLLLNVILPGALPSVLVGLRYALGITWLTLIVAETIASDNGIGYMTMNARDFLQTDVMILGICLYALLGKVADMLTRFLERRLLRWNPAYHSL
ncbi:MAG: aliphatic sulfonate ABC transporter permease SsuC [Verrucomicrobia bacterium]|nr:aliphatic sulfonate ABC transporter permease SsuC [Verrucomicrobiota bacterium]